MLELMEKAIVTSTPTQTTSDTWLDFIMRDGKTVTIKGRKANGDFLQMCLHSSNEVEGNWYPIRIIMCMDKKWHTDPELESWEEDYKVWIYDNWPLEQLD